MYEAPAIDTRTTDGEIAVVNLESMRRRAWSRFFQDPLREGVAETVVEQEQLTLQFVGDVAALDRLDLLINRLVELDRSVSARTTLIQAQVASTTHRFSDARGFLTQAELAGALPVDVNRLRLNIDQACGTYLDKVLNERRENAQKSGRTEDLISLAALLADLRKFADADRLYNQALRAYRDVSPFPVAWVYFQLGALWGELVPERQTADAAQWYLKAIDCLPGYTKARVHLAEIHLCSGRSSEAEALLVPAIASGDPEVRWRLADVAAFQGKTADAEAHMQAARSGFEALIARHRLAFADHGAEFFAGSGSDVRRALDLARLNVENRPTLRAFEQAYAIATSADAAGAASELLAAATRHWGATPAFQLSSLVGRNLETKGAAA